MIHYLGGDVTENTVQAWITEEFMIAKEKDKGRGNQSTVGDQ